MSDERWIHIRHWERFQHADMMRSGVPPWIKNYTRLMSDDNYLGLTEHQALVLHRLWLTYASARCHLRLNTASLSRHLHVRVMSRDLEALNHAGFIEFLQAPPDASVTRVQDRGEENREELLDINVKGFAVNEARPEGTAKPEKSVEEQEQELGERLRELERQLAKSLEMPW